MGKVIVAGGINMDVVATTARQPKVGETLEGKEVKLYPGGKGANQALAAAKFGATTGLIGKLGDDLFAAELRGFLGGQGIDLALVGTAPGAGSGVAVITVTAAANNTIIFAPGANRLLAPEDVETVKLGPGDVLVSQCEIPADTVRRFFERGRAVGARTMLNCSPLDDICGSLLDLADIIIVNEVELAQLTNGGIHAPENTPAISAAARSIRTRPDQTVIVTLGAHGSMALTPERRILVPGRSVAAVDTTGAGDCYAGTLAAALAQSAELETAMSCAGAAAAISVTRPGAGTSMPSRAETLAALEQD